MLKSEVEKRLALLKTPPSSPKCPSIVTERERNFRLKSLSVAIDILNTNNHIALPKPPWPTQQLLRTSVRPSP